ncbi:DUF3558 domain-containing protein [Lentzea kentuckyensis]|uniref:DUF3558 domain-containing protein n=1 Tax=Lentzea kentuckyensis TaxID=360086 RepID=UPI000A36F318|nr:DUF3558 domain-containing protein [Lentzea kentuckyensis]
MNKKFIVSISALILVALSACTGSGEKGNANPDSSASSTPQSAGQLPKRPAELKVDNVDACKLLTTKQMDEIKLAQTSPNQSKVIDGKPLPACIYKNNLSYSYIVVPATSKGVGYWLNGGGNVSAEVVDVAGYGAAEIKLIGVDAVDCAVSVDVADGQQLFVSYHPDSDAKETQQQMCDKAKKAAGLALETLKTLK